MTHVEMKVGDASAKTLTLIGIQNLPAGPVTFSLERAVEVTAEHAQRTKELFVGDERLIEAALADLEKDRILVLAGKPGCGTSTMAIYLATRVPHMQSTLVVAPLEQKVEIDLANIDFAKRTTIFIDAFSRRNRDLAGFFSRRDALEWISSPKSCGRRKPILIFTSEPEDIASFRVARRDVRCLLAISSGAGSTSE